MTENNNDFYNNDLAEEETVKTEPVVVEEEVLEAPVVEEPEEIAIVEEKPVKAKKAPKPVAETAEEKVALFAHRNLDWSGVGTLKAGYNIVSKDKADLWLGASRKVRLATPEEVAAKAAK